MEERRKRMTDEIKELKKQADFAVEEVDMAWQLKMIFEKELEEKKLPFIILRPMPDGSCEYWKLKDLEIIKY